MYLQVSKLMSDNLDAQLEATSYFRKLLSIEKRPPIEDVVRQPNVVRRLVEFLGYDHNQRLQFEAAWALTNVRFTTRTSQLVPSMPPHVVQYIPQRTLHSAGCLV